MINYNCYLRGIIIAYSGKFRPINEKKYEGDYNKITYRSLWERGLMRWVDENPDVKSWSSEEIVIPYISPVDNKSHRYYMDFKITFISGSTILVEVKPAHETRPPVRKVTKRPTNKQQMRYLTEAKTFAVNDAKWAAAKKYADRRGWKFVIFTQDTLQNLGIGIGKR